MITLFLFSMAVDVQLNLNKKLSVREPQETSLGKKIIEHSIILIEKIGFEQFTFKKLAQKISSTEASIYRYFENKHSLLLYIMSWYWEWIDYEIDINSKNIKDPKQKLRIAISTLAVTSAGDYTPSYINIKLLHHIVITEGSKAYHTKMVDKENKKGLFLPYKKLAEKLVKLFSEINPSFPYPRLLASTMLEMANEQVFYAKHINNLTDIQVKREDYSELQKAMEFFAFKMLR